MYKYKNKLTVKKGNLSDFISSEIKKNLLFVKEIPVFKITVSELVENGICHSQQLSKITPSCTTFPWTLKVPTRFSATSKVFLNEFLTFDFKNLGGKTNVFASGVPAIEIWFLVKFGWKETMPFDFGFAP